MKMLLSPKKGLLLSSLSSRGLHSVKLLDSEIGWHLEKLDYHSEKFTQFNLLSRLFAFYLEYLALLLQFLRIRLKPVREVGLFREISYKTLGLVFSFAMDLISNTT